MLRFCFRSDDVYLFGVHGANVLAWLGLNSDHIHHFKLYTAAGAEASVAPAVLA